MSRPAARPDTLTPLMRQYYAVKEQHPDKTVFFRMGDFYEMFGDDAVRMAPILGIALTARSHGANERIPLAGVPYHSVEKYLARLLEHGEKVVIVEQVEDPKTAKGIVRREVVEILTPGTATVDGITGDRTANWLTAYYPGSNKSVGLAALDLSTGEFAIDEGNESDILERLKVLEPSEILFPSSQETEILSEALGMTNGNNRISRFDEWHFDYKTALRELNEHFGTSTLDGFGVGDCRSGIVAAGAIYRYLKENNRHRLAHIRSVHRFNQNDLMLLDYSTIRNLELLKSTATGSEHQSLLSVLNRCHTAAGTRRLQQSLIRPFRTRERVMRRQSGVAELVRNRELAFAIRETMKRLPDLERLAGRLGLGKLNPRQMGAIRDALVVASHIKSEFTGVQSEHLKVIKTSIPESAVIIDKLNQALVDEPPLISSGGNVVREGYSPELDALNESIREARQFIASLQRIERERTGIGSLKVGFNKVFGYYLEVTNTNLAHVPGDYIRKQTLVNAERYITPDLKEKEELIQNAEEKIFALESRLYEELVAYLNEQIADIMLTADLLAELDLVAGLSEVAVSNGYCQPELHNDGRLKIVNGRHPVIETVLPAGSFVGNDTHFSTDGGEIHVLTGPNMSGKSTYLRQIGLIVIMAHIGSFVPADRAEIGLVDRVFTRVGALDNLARGQSTFLVEMVETANILHHATEKSLILLDEVGRGTSTFDGMSVAWAVVEYLNENIHARTIFATHYHELTGMAALYDRIRNFQVAVKKWQNRVVFLHQIIPGGCDDSYGIEVAKLAGLPRQTITRAKQILGLLESGKFAQSELGQGIYKAKVQPNLFEAPTSQIEEKMKTIDPDNMTPLEALHMLQELKKELS